MAGYVYIIGIIVALIINIVFCFKFGELAEAKGYSPSSYFWLCFFFGMVGSIMVAALPDEALRSQVFNLKHIQNKSANSGKSASIVSASTVTAPSDSLPPISKASVIDDESWLCGNCQTINSKKYGQCKKCGRFRG